MKRRKFADGGETTEMEPSSEGGRFSKTDPDIYARARRFVESGGKKEEESKPVRKATSAPATKEAPAERSSDTSKRFPSEAKSASKEAPAERSSDTSKRSPSEAKSASKDDYAKSVSERIKEFRERARTRDTGTDTRPVNERIFGTKTKVEEPSAKRAEIPTSSSGPKAPASTGESTSGPSNLDRVLMATGAGAGLTGAAALAYKAKRAYDAKRAAENMKASRAATNTGGAPRAALLAQADARAKAADQARLPKDIMDMLNKPYKKGGTVKKYAEGGMVGSASRRADGIATKGKTKCKIY
jgi:hypothetical protein